MDACVCRRVVAHGTRSGGTQPIPIHVSMEWRIVTGAAARFRSDGWDRQLESAPGCPRLKSCTRAEGATESRLVWVGSIFKIGDRDRLQRLQRSHPEPREP